jgi:hypothetical protein
MKTKYFLFLLLIISFVPKISSATEMFFSPASVTVQKGELIKINLYLTSPEDSLNAAEGKLIFPGDLLSVSNINFGNSVLNFWPEQPHLEKDGVIIFSGVTPGGFGSAGQNLLFTVFFKALKEGKANLEIKDAVALKNDGAGTPSNMSTGKGAVIITAKSTATTPGTSGNVSAELNLKNDTEPPESFTPLVGNNPGIFDGKYFLVFTTNDKQSGIDHYEVQESRSNSAKNNAWIKAESPYPLSDQALHSFVFVRAFDKAQNIRIAVLSPLYPQKLYQSPLFWIIIVLVCSALLFLKRRSIFFHNEK